MITLEIGNKTAQVNLKARRTMNGEIMIYDHPEMDIVVSPGGNKIVSIPKEQYGNHIYATQSRLFDHLSKKGVVDPAKIRSGNVFGSLEGAMLVVEESQKELINPSQVAIYSIAKFLQQEAPLYNFYREYEQSFEDELTDPPDDDTTRLGKIPHEPRQGTVNMYPGSSAAYGLVGYYMGE